MRTVGLTFKKTAKTAADSKKVETKKVKADTSAPKNTDTEEAAADSEKQQK